MVMLPVLRGADVAVGEFYGGLGEAGLSLRQLRLALLYRLLGGGDVLLDQAGGVDLRLRGFYRGFGGAKLGGGLVDIGAGGGALVDVELTQVIAMGDEFVGFRLRKLRLRLLQLGRGLHLLDLQIEDCGIELRLGQLDIGFVLGFFGQCLPGVDDEQQLAGGHVAVVGDIERGGRSRRRWRRWRWRCHRYRHRRVVCSLRVANQ